ncbi:tyrosine-type recombinase/integrase [Methanobrevibacter cuticularis]|nr:tyrosine-type recombinase/integrase [Methanobrevibacter cuticularis]
MLKYNPLIARTRIRDIHFWNDVKKGLDFCEEVRDKAFISFIVTSGMRVSDVVKLTIEDFLDASSIYNHDYDLDEILSKNPYNIVPCYDFFPVKTKKDGNLCITFNSGECTYFIFKCRRNITNVVVKTDKYTELDVISIFTGHTPPNMSNPEVYDAVDSEDSFDSYLRKNYEALIPYLTINKKENIVNEDNKNLESEIMKIKESVDILLSNKNQLVSKS